MKKIQVLIITLLIYLYIPVSTVSAHLVGQPPFFLMNGTYSNLYAVPTTSLSDFILPQDSAPDNYLVNQPITLEFDVNKMPVPPDIVKQTKFTWDFGDGSKGEGLKNIHSYSKMGSYIISINAQYVSDPQPTLIQSVVLNVLPDKNYKLPQSIIKINGQKSKDPLTDILKEDFKQPILLDGSDSNSPNGIISYEWDLGDVHKADSVKVTHTYDPQNSQLFPVLRVKDKNGFFADSFVEIENGPPNHSAAPLAEKTQVSSSKTFPFIYLGVAVIILITIFLALKIRKSKR